MKPSRGIETTLTRPLQVNMMFAGVVACLCATIPETYAPAILLKRAKRLRAETGDLHITTEQELFKKSLEEIIVETAIRPFREFC